MQITPLLSVPWVYIVVSKATIGFLECIASRISSDIFSKPLFVDIARYEGEIRFDKDHTGLHLRGFLPKDRESMIRYAGGKVRGFGDN